MRRALAAASLTLLASGCLNTSTPGTTIDSDPPGAIVYVDGRQSGYATPCTIDLGAGGHREVRLVLDGYQPAVIDLVGETRVSVVPWTRGVTNESGLFFPLFLPWNDLVEPLHVERFLAPDHVFVHLHPTLAP